MYVMVVEMGVTKSICLQTRKTWRKNEKKNTIEYTCNSRLLWATTMVILLLYILKFKRYTVYKERRHIHWLVLLYCVTYGAVVPSFLVWLLGSPPTMFFSVPFLIWLTPVSTHIRAIQSSFLCYTTNKLTFFPCFNMFLCALYFLKDFWCLKKENCKFRGRKVTKRAFTSTLSLLFSVEGKRETKKLVVMEACFWFSNKKRCFVCVLIV